MSRETERSLESYLSDLKTVKDLLIRHDEKSMLEPWTFFVWGVLVAAGTVVHSLLVGRSSGSIVAIWVPIVVAGGISETLAWLSRMNKEQTPLLGRRFVRFILSAGGVFAAILPIGIALYRAGLLSPGLILIMSAVVFLVYAEITFSSLFIESYLVLTIGVVLQAAGLASRGAFIAAGIVLSVSFLAFGLHSVVLERGMRRRQR